MISLILQDNLFENDIRWLTLSFFHNEKIRLSAEDWNKRLTVYHSETLVSFILEDKEKVITAEAHWNIFDKRAAKDILKRALYNMYKEYTGRDLLWGTFSGIRPAKFASIMIEEGRSYEDIRDEFKDTYYMSDEKIKLCYDVATNEKRILSGIPYKDEFSLYFGIPFCPSICAYCSFSSFPISKWDKRVDEYIDAMEQEIIYVAQHYSGKNITSVYMGGGTPTSINAMQLDKVISNIKKHFDLKGTREFTVEAGRPDSITKDKLKVLKDHGVGRISINPQTMNQKTLDAIGRRHTVEQVIDAFVMAREEGFNNINMDTIIGLPGETIKDTEHTFNIIRDLDPDSLTVHSLAIKRAADLNTKSAYANDISQSDMDEMIRQAHGTAAELGMEPYYMYRQKNMAGELENIGYARKGSEGIYNILIMEQEQSIVGIGAGASSKLLINNEIVRTENVKSVKDYIERLPDMLARKVHIKDI